MDASMVFMLTELNKIIFFITRIEFFFRDQLS